jgi:transposase-like protein
MADENHGEKMCALACCPCNLDIEKLKPLVRNAKFICSSCGRVAAEQKNLCQPVALEA